MEYFQSLWSKHNVQENHPEWLDRCQVDTAFSGCHPVPVTREMLPKLHKLGVGVWITISSHAEPHHPPWGRSVCHLLQGACASWSLPCQALPKTQSCAQRKGISPRNYLVIFQCHPQNKAICSCVALLDNLFAGRMEEWLWSPTEP